MFEPTPAQDLAVVGTDVPRVEADEKLTGAALYTGDLVLPGMLHAKVKESPHARAKILSIDTSKAEALPGVRAVLVGSELTYKVGLYVVDKDILAKDEVRHYGEAVAAVAAETIEIASHAVELIDVEYEVEMPILNQVDALAPDAPLVHPDLGSYQYVEAAFSPQPGTNIPNKIRRAQGRHRAGLRRGRVRGRARVHQPVGPARADGDPRRDRPVDGPATRSRSGRAPSRRSRSATCSASPSGCR